MSYRRNKFKNMLYLHKQKQNSMKTEKIAFDLARYNKGEYISLETRRGNPARILCTNKKDDEYPIVVLENVVEDWEDAFTVSKTGIYDNYVGISDRDLFMVVNKQNPKYGDEYWFICTNGELCLATFVCAKCDIMRFEFGNFFETKEEAKKYLEKIKNILNTDIN